MKPNQIERELRACLRPLSEEGEQQLVIATADELVSSLLPWIVETVEEAEAVARMDEGRLP